MPRGYFVNGEVLVRVKGAAGSILATAPFLTAPNQLGLCSDSVTITPNFRHMDVPVDAWGGDKGPPPEVQWMLADVKISMTLVHYDDAVLKACLQHSMAAGVDGVARGVGTLTRAGVRYGNDAAITAAGNSFIQLYLSSPIGGKPWYFPATIMTGPPMTIPLGVQRSLVQVNFRAIPYQADPYGGGTGALDAVLWDHTTII